MTPKEIIKQAKVEADERFEAYLEGLADEMEDTTTDNLKRCLEAEKKLYRQQIMYDVRNEGRLLSLINMVIHDKRAPYSTFKGLPYFAFTATNEEILTSLIRTQYLQLLKIEYLKRRLRPGHQEPDQRLSLSQTALIHIYNEIPITTDNANEIAIKGGWVSGVKLLQDYNKFQRPSDRIGTPKDPSRTKMKNKIVLFESVLPYLTNTGLARAIDEIQILKNKIEAEYG